MTLQLHGKTPRQIAKMVDWAQRREKYGPSGCSPETLAKQRIVVAAAHAAVRRKGRARQCRAGHRMTLANTRWSAVDHRSGYRRRYCRACDAVAAGRAAWRRVQQRKIAALRQAMIAAHPDKGGTVTRFDKARKAYLRARVAA